MINPKQLREHIVRPALNYLNSEIPYSRAAEDLLMGTCAQESALGKYLTQTNGPALGIFQMEPNTYNDIFNNYLCCKDDLLNMTDVLLCPELNTYDEFDLILSPIFSAAMCRIHYWRVSEPLPAEGDIEGMAHYWKKYYNTVKGKGTVEEFIGNYQRYLAHQ